MGFLSELVNGSGLLPLVRCLALAYLAGFEFADGRALPRALAGRFVVEVRLLIITRNTFRKNRGKSKPFLSQLEAVYGVHILASMATDNTQKQKNHTTGHKREYLTSKEIKFTMNHST